MVKLYDLCLWCFKQRIALFFPSFKLNACFVKHGRVVYHKYPVALVYYMVSSGPEHCLWVASPHPNSQELCVPLS
jgi:disulfide bond formation protein DsbB